MPSPRKEMACPKCGSKGPFHVTMEVEVEMFDDGDTGVFSEPEWDEESTISCCDCGELAQVKDFQLPKKTRKL